MDSLILPRWKSLAATRWSVVVPKEMQPVLIETGGWEASFGAGTTEFMARLLAMLAPHRPGDVVPVREAWRAPKDFDDTDDPEQMPSEWNGFSVTIWYCADGEPPAPFSRVFGRVRPADTMPDWAIRHTFRIDSVSAQWLPDVSEDEAEAEGVEPVLTYRGWNRDTNREGPASHLAALEDHMTADGHPWESWVWVYSGAFVPYQSDEVKHELP